MSNLYINKSMVLKYNSIFPFNSDLNNKITSLNKKLITKPIFIYDKPLENREKIKKDLNGYSGIYLWYNNHNGKCYIGSGINLYKRISNYYQNTHLRRSYPIINAINKYGLNSFTLVILKLLGKSEEDIRLFRLEREDYYLSTYLPK